MKVVCKNFLVRVPGQARRRRVTFNVRVCVVPQSPRLQRKPRRK